jgi:hypothetical protein
VASIPKFTGVRAFTVIVKVWLTVAAGVLLAASSTEMEFVVLASMTPGRQ